MVKEEVTIVIPIYKEVMSNTEHESLRQCLRVLNKYRIAFAAPSFMDAAAYCEITKQYGIEFHVEKFEDNFFRSIQGYNSLMLSKSFYKRFINSRYILIYQLDAFVFKDDLLNWSRKGFDYIGAPWIDDQHYKNLVSGSKKWFWRTMTFLNRIMFCKSDWLIGNGGLSLRNVEKSILVLSLFNSFVSKLRINEDLFWAIYAPLLCPIFKVPNLKVGIAFAFEQNPEYFFKLNGNQLPFGCHAWEKYDFQFWKKYIRSNNQPPF